MLPSHGLDVEAQLVGGRGPGRSLLSPPRVLCLVAVHVFSGGQHDLSAVLDFLPRGEARLAEDCALAARSCVEKFAFSSV